MLNLKKKKSPGFSELSSDFFLSEVSETKKKNKAKFSRTQHHWHRECYESLKKKTNIYRVKIARDSLKEEEEKEGQRTWAREVAGDYKPENQSLVERHAEELSSSSVLVSVFSPFPHCLVRSDRGVLQGVYRPLVWPEKESGGL